MSDFPVTAPASAPAVALAEPYPGFEQSDRIGDLTAAISRMVAAVGLVELTKATGLPYEFLSEKAAIQSIRGPWSEYGLSIMPADFDILEKDQYQSKNGTMMVRYIIKAKYRVSHTSGQWAIARGLGEASDSGDKCLNKCMTDAFKYVLRQLCMLYGGHDPDETGGDDVARGNSSTPKTQPKSSDRPRGEAKRPAPAESNPEPINYPEKLKSVLGFIAKQEDVKYVNASVTKARSLGFPADMLAQITAKATEQKLAIYKRRISGSDGVEAIDSIVTQAASDLEGSPQAVDELRRYGAEVAEVLAMGENAAADGTDVPPQDDPIGMDF